MNLNETIETFELISANLKEFKYLQNRIWWVVTYLGKKKNNVNMEYPINSIKATFEIHTDEEIKLFRELVNSEEFGEHKK